MQNVPMKDRLMAPKFPANSAGVDSPGNYLAGDVIRSPTRCPSLEHRGELFNVQHFIAQLTPKSSSHSPRERRGSSRQPALAIDNRQEINGFLWSTLAIDCPGQRRAAYPSILPPFLVEPLLPRIQHVLGSPIKTAKSNVFAVFLTSP